MVLELGLTLLIISQSPQTQNIENILQKQLSKEYSIVFNLDNQNTDQVPSLVDYFEQFAIIDENSRFNLNLQNSRYGRNNNVYNFTNQVRENQVRDNRRHIHSKLPQVLSTKRHARFEKTKVSYV